MATGEVRRGHNTPSPAKEAGRDEACMLTHTLPSDPSYRELRDYIAIALDIDPDRLTSRTREHEVCEARHLIALILQNRSKWSLAQIARAMKVTSRAVRHRIDAGNDLIETDTNYRRLYERLVQR